MLFPYLVSSSLRTIATAFLFGFLVMTLSRTGFCQDQNPEKPELASLIKVIADSKGYNRKLITVGGYLQMVSGHALLYVSSEHGKAGDLPSSILIEVSEQEKASLSMLSGNWIKIVGRFEHNLLSPQTPYSGKLQDVVEFSGI